ncbi:MAG: transporter, family, putative transporter [Clostridiales bacterium]|nr:transporter, family, putative transporter [Clostridiales bacterium]
MGKFHPQSYLSPELITLLTVHAFFLLGVGLSNTFINIFLWKVEKDLSIVILFNAIYYATIPLVFIFAGWLAKRMSLTFNLRLGIICYSILYIILLILQNNAAKYVWLLGILLGISGGFYYLSYNVLGYDFTTDDNRDYVMGVQGLVLSMSTMIAPVAAGSLIELIKGLKGYVLIFSISLTLFLIAAVLSTKIPIQTINKHYYIKSILFMPFKKKNWRYVMIGESFRGFREGVMMFLIGVLIFSMVNSELFVGYYTLASSMVQLYSFYFISRRMRPGTRKKYLFIGVVAVMIAALVFLLALNVVTLLIYSIIISFFVTFINNPTAGIIYWVIHKTPNSKKRRIEGIVVREVYLNIGRVLGVLLLLLTISKNANAIPFIIVCLSLSQIVVWYLFNKVKIE